VPLAAAHLSPFPSVDDSAPTAFLSFFEPVTLPFLCSPLGSGPLLPTQEQQAPLPSPWYLPPVDGPLFFFFSFYVCTSLTTFPTAALSLPPYGRAFPLCTLPPFLLWFFRVRLPTFPDGFNEYTRSPIDKLEESLPPRAFFPRVQRSLSFFVPTFPRSIPSCPLSAHREWTRILPL